MTSPTVSQRIQEEDMVEEQSSESSEKHVCRVFAAVVASVQLDRLAEHASTVRQAAHPTHQDIGPHVPEIGSPIFGSYHALYPVKFSDGVCWLYKVPADGTRDKFGQSNARALRSEALTMRLLKRETTIPTPGGKPLYDVWFDKGSPTEIVRSRRIRTLKDIAAAMVQLDKFSSDQGGSMIFDDQNSPIGVGPALFLNSPAMLNRLRNDDPDELAIYLEAGPFEDPTEYYTVTLDSRKDGQEYGREDAGTSFERGLLSLLRLLIAWIREPAPRNGNQKPFVLEHPDMDIQNFLVDEDGALQAIIDWDGVGYAPRSLGNRRYPSFLTRDWDPAMYAWNEDMERGIEPVGLWEDSPETLKFYRRVYAGLIASDLAAEFNLTRNSLVYENLQIAANDPLCTFPIIKKMINVIEEVVREDGLSTGIDGDGAKGRSELDEDSEVEEFNIFDICWALDENRLCEDNRNLLKAGFDKLLQGNGIL